MTLQDKFAIDKSKLFIADLIPFYGIPIYFDIVIPAIVVALAI